MPQKKKKKKHQRSTGSCSAPVGACEPRGAIPAFHTHPPVPNCKRQFPGAPPCRGELNGPSSPASLPPVSTLQFFRCLESLAPPDPPSPPLVAPRPPPGADESHGCKPLKLGDPFRCSISCSPFSLQVFPPRNLGEFKAPQTTRRFPGSAGLSSPKSRKPHDTIQSFGGVPSNGNGGTRRGPIPLVPEPPRSQPAPVPRQPLRGET